MSMFDQPSNPNPSARETPLCDYLSGLPGTRNLHTLPAAGLQSLNGSSILPRYLDVLGEPFLQGEFSCTGGDFGSPMQPHAGGVLAQSLDGTARAFGADRSWYVVSGTTTANYAAVYAVSKHCKRVLCDGAVHQSILFALETADREGFEVCFVPIKASSDGSERSVADIDWLLDEYRRAEASGKPYEAVILTACSYEGVQLNLDAIFEELLAIRDDVLFVIDEAWNAIRAFCPLEQAKTAIGAAQRVATHHGEKQFGVIVTQSAHKSMSAPRQASFIHVCGDDALMQAVDVGRRRYETTSPSYPILGGLELARAQAAEEGPKLLEAARRRAQRLRDTIASMDGYDVLITDELESPYVSIDPLRVSIGFEVPQNGKALKQYLLDQHAVYVNRVTNTSLLVNVHIGVNDDGIAMLIAGLAKYAFLGQKLGADLVPYPPGRAVAMRGDEITIALMALIERLLGSGAEFPPYGPLEDALVNACRS